ncbi:MAG: hypothetical protein GY703_00195 [Gammaproteobacteria bacterium]|nr:hypothetical protein [Gammaproteobacteria bacterium]
MSKQLIDPQSNLVEKQFAVVFAPRRQRTRFPENCVTIKSSGEQALADSDLENKHYPAIVYGPSRSSEGFRLYYLVEWLD